MTQGEVLRLLKNAEGPISGEEMSRTLGVSRAAIWKAVTGLREQGYDIGALPAKGYWLQNAPDILFPGELDHPGRAVGRRVICLKQVDSTNDACKRLAMEDGSDGLAVVAGEQTRGKGRRGRSFQSLEGKGLYLSVLLRPRVSPTVVSQITAWSAVAVCRALEKLTPLRPDIKWPNDILLEGRKLCGILTELGLEGESGQVDYVVVGIGVNMTQTREDFGPELWEIATSLGQNGVILGRSALAAALLDELDKMYRCFPVDREEYLSDYRERCVTLGRKARICGLEGEETVLPLAVGEDFALWVRHQDGRETRVTAGEVSVRGLC